MFMVAMLYLLGVVVSSISCAYTHPRWLNGGQHVSHPSAVLVAGLLWPLLLVGVAHIALSVALHKVEVHRTVHARYGAA
jgi:hypothetical protein